MKTLNAVTGLFLLTAIKLYRVIRPGARSGAHPEMETSSAYARARHASHVVCRSRD